MFVQSELPPELTKGRDMPVLGIIPVATPTFTKVWKTNIPATPAAMSLSFISLASIAIIIHLTIIKNSKANTSIQTRVARPNILSILNVL